MPEGTDGQGAMPTTPAGETPAGNQPTLAEVTAELETVRRALKDANKEAADRRKKLDAYEAAEAERKQAEMTEAQKADTARKAAEEKAQKAIQQADAKLKRAAFMAEASKYGVVRPEDAYALALADGFAGDVGDDGNVSGVTEAVKALVDAGRLPRTGAPQAPGLDAGAGAGPKPEKSIHLTEQQKQAAMAGGMTEEQYITYLKKGIDAVQNGIVPNLGTMPK